MASSFCQAKTQTCTLSSLTILLVDSVAPVTDRTRYRYPRVFFLSLSLCLASVHGQTYTHATHAIQGYIYAKKGSFSLSRPARHLSLSLSLSVHFPNISARYHRCYYRNPNYTADEVERGGVIIENFIVRPLPEDLKRLNRDTYNTDNLSVKIPFFLPLSPPRGISLRGIPVSAGETSLEPSLISTPRFQKFQAEAEIAIGEFGLIMRSSAGTEYPR